jgi:CMP-N-acetylneuraminic acid synthetase
MNNKKIAMIPARLGSQRLKKKNLEIFGKVTLIEYAIQRCKSANIFDAIYVNSESEVFKDYALKQGVNFYHRPENLGSNQATSEEFIEDFLKNVECDSLYQVHSITPLLRATDIKSFVEFCEINPDIDTVLSCINDQIEVAYKNQPINFSLTEKTNSQELTVTQRVTWSITKWSSRVYLDTKSKGGIGTYSGLVGFYPVNPYTGLAIKTAEDLKIARALQGVI